MFPYIDDILLLSNAKLDDYVDPTYLIEFAIWNNIDTAKYTSYLYSHLLVISDFLVLHFNDYTFL